MAPASLASSAAATIATTATASAATPPTRKLRELGCKGGRRDWRQDIGLGGLALRPAIHAEALTATASLEAPPTPTVLAAHHVGACEQLVDLLGQDRLGDEFCKTRRKRKNKQGERA